MPTVVYHHTSTLRTNLIWMSGVIEVEGAGEKPFHPHLGVVGQEPRFRRALKDFPPLAWFTTRVEIPKCLIEMKLLFQSKETGELVGELPMPDGASDALSLTRMAIEFKIKDIPVVPWPDYYGYNMSEGEELNATARECGDNPNHWYVSEQPIDVGLLSSVWTPRKGNRHRLERNDRYLPDVKRMVALCRAQPGVFIPPSWMSDKQAHALAALVGVPVGNLPV